MKRKPFRYDEGGDVNEEFARPIKSTADAKSETAEPKKMSFKEAFAEARGDGKKSFEWNGKKYTTDMKKEKDDSVGSQDRRDKLAREAGEKYAKISRAEAEAPEGTSDAAKAALRKSKDDALSEYNIRSYAAKGGNSTQTAKQSKPTQVAKYAKGGSVSSASKRADGIATKGKTKGRMR